MNYFDHIIANPPFRICNKITYTLLNTLDFTDYVNLMPYSHYIPRKLYQYVCLNTFEKVEWTGDLIYVSPSISVLSKEPDSSITEADFRVLSYDEKFSKFFSENFKRKETCRWCGNCVTPGEKEKWEEKVQKRGISQKTAFLFHTRSVFNGVSKTPNSYIYRWNVTGELNEKNVAEETTKHWFKFWLCIFKTSEEKNNFVKWWFSDPVNGLATRLCKATGGNSPCPNPVVPRLDWSREWTDKEILLDYGYTDEEINSLLFSE